MNDEPEFFVGWQKTVPPQTRRRLQIVALLLAGTAAAVAILVAAGQRTIGPATWEYGREREFSGLLVADPVPMLLAFEPDEQARTATFLLVNPNKFGFDPAVARARDGQAVRLRASLLYRDGRGMLEVVPGSVTPTRDADGAVPVPAVVDRGEHVLRGEIVDSKCFLGAMNPGHLKPHRACAIRCISGGVPPILLVRDTTGRAVYYILVGPDGESINRDVLDFVAEPVEITGRVQQRGTQLILRARVGAIQRLP